MMNCIFRYLLLLCILIPLRGLAATCVEQQHSVPVAVVEFNAILKQLKVSVKQGSLADVLQRVTIETGILFIGDAGRCDEVSIEFDYLELSRALSQLLAGRNYVVQAESGQQIMRVWLLPAGNEDSMTEKEVLVDEFYRQLHGASNVEDLAERIRQLGLEQ